jgi:hypothetical protein
MEIGVRILNRHRDEWVLVPAQPVSGIGNLYCIIDHDRHPDLELEFAPGNLVTVLEMPDSDGRVRPVAHRLKGFPL